LLYDQRWKFSVNKRKERKRRVGEKIEKVARNS